MSESKDGLLGKKRELEKDNEDKDNSVEQKKARKTEGKPEEKDNDESSSSSPSQPKKSLFSNKETGFKGGLFGDLDNPDKAPTSLFSNTQSGSLFGNTTKPPHLYSVIPQVVAFSGILVEVYSEI